MKTDDAKAQMAKIAADLLNAIEGKLPEIATEVSDKFKVPQRDVLHTLRNSFRSSRGRLAEEMRDAALSLPREVETVVHADERANTQE